MSMSDPENKANAYQVRYMPELNPPSLLLGLWTAPHARRAKTLNVILALFN